MRDLEKSYEKGITRNLTIKNEKLKHPHTYNSQPEFVNVYSEYVKKIVLRSILLKFNFYTKLKVDFSNSL